MAIPNFVGVFALSGVVAKETKDFTIIQLMQQLQQKKLTEQYFSLLLKV